MDGLWYSAIGSQMQLTHSENRILLGSYFAVEGELGIDSVSEEPHDITGHKNSSMERELRRNLVKENLHIACLHVSADVFPAIMTNYSRMETCRKSCQLNYVMHLAFNIVGLFLNLNCVLTV